MAENTVDQSVIVAAEQQERVKVPITRQQRELEVISDNILFRQMDKVGESFKTKSEEEQQSASKGERSLYVYKLLSETKSASFIKDSQPEGWNPKGEKPLVITVNGEEVKINTIQSAGIDDFSCVIEDSTGRETAVSVPRADILNAQLIAEKDAILTTLSPEERAAVELHIQQLEKDEHAFDEEASENRDQIIEAAAKTSGMLHKDNIKRFIDKIAADRTPADGAPIPLEDQAHMAKREQALQLLEGKNLVDAADTIKVLDALGINAESMSTHIEQAQKQIDTARQLLAVNPQDEQAKAALTKAEEGKRLWERAAESFGENGEIQAYFREIQEGRVDRETAEKLIQAFQEGDVDKIIESAFPDLKENPNDTPEVAEEKKKKRRELTKLAKDGGIGILLALALAIAGATATAYVAAKAASKE